MNEYLISDGVVFINKSKCNAEQVNELVESCKKGKVAYCIVELGKAFDCTYWDKDYLSIKGRQLIIIPQPDYILANQACAELSYEVDKPLIETRYNKEIEELAEMLNLSIEDSEKFFSAGMRELLK